MASQRVLASLLEGVSMLRRPRSMRQALAPLLGLVALANLGCTTSIAATYPHLERRSVCLLVPGIEADATEFIFAEGNVPISNLHPEVVDRVAPTARTVFERDPNADPDSVRYLPAPYNELTCPTQFSMLPSGEPQQSPLPEASLALVLHERRPEPVSKTLADELAKCSNQISGPVKPIQHTMQVNVYVKDDGHTGFAYVADSTLGNRQLNACVVNVLRKTRWSAIATSAPNVAAAPVALKGLFAQPAPVMPQPDSGPESGIRRIQPRVGVRIPRIFVIPLNPLVAAAAVFGIIYFWSDNDAPAWADELNPLTGQVYTSVEEYEDVRRLSQQEIKRQRAQITNSQSQPPPASTPAPAPVPPPAPTLTPVQQREQEKKRERCTKLANKIDEIINKERPATPPGGKPQGRKGIKWRWREIAENIGKWGPRPDGKPGKQMEGHLDAYDAAQREIIKALDSWQAAGCDDKDHGLPHNARQYAAQTPEFGPGKPLEPAPTPEYYPPTITPAIVPQPKKASK